MRQSKPMTLTIFAALFAIMALAEGNAQAQASYKPPNTEVPNPYQAPRSWGQLPKGRESLPFFSGITVDAKNHIWAFVRCPGGCSSATGKTLDTVLEYDTSGKLLRSWGAGLFNTPHSIDVDKDGNIWLVDSLWGIGGVPASEVPKGKGERVFKFTPDGKLLLTIGKADRVGSGPDEFDQPTGVKVASNGDVFVASGHNFPTCPNSRIQKFSKDGKFIKEFGKQGSGPGALTCPHQLAFDSKGRLFVAELGSNFRVSIWDQDGNFLTAWKQFGGPTGVYIDIHDVLYATESVATDNMKMNPNAPGHGYQPGVKRGIRIGSVKDGKVTGFVPDPNPPDLPVHGREVLAVDHDGNIYQVPDSSNKYLDNSFKKYVKK